MVLKSVLKGRVFVRVDSTSLQELEEINRAIELIERITARTHGLLKNVLLAIIAMAFAMSTGLIFLHYIPVFIVLTTDQYVKSAVVVTFIILGILGLVWGLMRARRKTEIEDDLTELAGLVAGSAIIRDMTYVCGNILRFSEDSQQEFEKDCARIAQLPLARSSPQSVPQNTNPNTPTFLLTRRKTQPTQVAGFTDI